MAEYFVVMWLLLMALLACLFGIIAVGIGLGSSLQWDLPAGPAIALSAALLFFASPFTRLGKKGSNHDRS